MSAARYQRQGSIDFAGVRELARGRLLEIVRALVDTGAQQRTTEIWFRDPRKPNDTERTSASIHSETGLWHCRATSETGGDVVSLVAYARGCSQTEAKRLVCKTLGVDVPVSTGAGRRYSRRSSAAPTHEADRGAGRAPEAEPLEPVFAEQLWNAAGVIIDTPAQGYLEHRGIDPELVSSDETRHRPGEGLYDGANPDGSRRLLGTFATLVLPFREAPNGKVIAIHRIFLYGDGNKANVVSPESGEPVPIKRTTGRIGKSGLWFVRRDGEVGETLLICEGPEDALSLRQATGHAVLASASAVNLGKTELPDCVKRVVIVPDDNEAGERGLARAAQAYGRLEVLVARMPAGRDANDVLREDGAEKLAELVNSARSYGSDEELEDELEDDRLSRTSPRLAPELLEGIPGAMGDLACHLRDLDPTSDPVAALAMSVAAMCALTEGAYSFASAPNQVTFTDLLLVLVAGSGVGKSRALGTVGSLLLKAVENADRLAWEAAPLGSPEGIGTTSVKSARHAGSARQRWLSTSLARSCGTSSTLGITNTGSRVCSAT